MRGKPPWGKTALAVAGLPMCVQVCLGKGIPSLSQGSGFPNGNDSTFQDKRVVSEKWVSPCTTSPVFGIGSEEDEEEEEADHMFTFRMGKRMQLAVTMDNKAKVSREQDSSYTAAS